MVAYCCVARCTNTSKNNKHKRKGVIVKFYNFPRNSGHMPWLCEKRDIWIKAVKKYTKNPINFVPTDRTTICSAHFVGNKRSENPLHPSYVPSIFPGDEKNPQEWIKKIERHRQQLQEAKFVEMNIVENAVQGSTRNRRTKKRSVGCQTDVLDGLTSDRTEKYFFCGLNNLNGVCSAQVQVNTVSVDVCVKKEINVKIEPVDVKDVQVKMEACDDSTANEPVFVKSEVKCELEIKFEPESPEDDAANQIEWDRLQESVPECTNSEQSVFNTSENKVVTEDPERSCKELVNNCQVKEAVCCEKKEHICAACNKKYPTKVKLAYHMLIHTKEEPFACNLCSMRFRTSSDFSEHKQSHAQKNICHVCKKIFTYKVVLKAHMRTHNYDVKCSDSDIQTHNSDSELKPYVCHSCSQRFETSVSLYDHMVEHSQSDHVCHICNKGFASKKLLAAHARTHSEKLFDCDACNRQFTTLTGLNQHKRVHTKA